MRRVAFWVSVAFLIFFAIDGLQSLIGNWGVADTPGQRLCGLGQAVFGGAGLLAGVGAILKWSLARPAAKVFALSWGITAGVASVAWGGAHTIAGAASGLLGTGIGFLLYWGISGRPSPPPIQS